VKDGLGALRFGEIGSGVGRILRVLRDVLVPLRLSREDRDGPFELGLGLL
jgi:hypothetical protein